MLKIAYLKNTTHTDYDKMLLSLSDGVLKYYSYGAFLLINEIKVFDILDF